MHIPNLNSPESDEQPKFELVHLNEFVNELGDDYEPQESPRKPMTNLLSLIAEELSPMSITSMDTVKIDKANKLPVPFTSPATFLTTGMLRMRINQFNQ
jgi:hypothetical protein